MQPGARPSNPSRSELLMNVAATLAELTESLELCQQIPSYLCRTLGIAPVTLAILRESPVSGDSSLFLFSSSAIAAVDASDSSLRQNLMNVYDQTRSPTVAEGPALRPEFTGHGKTTEAGLGELPRTTVFSHKIDAEHRMLLVVHQSHDSQPLSSDLVSELELIARQLSRMLGCLVAWHTQPASLGSAFEKITSREWAVVRGLATDMGEKQIADQLQVSPHTLHSHVKSVYRRLGVQGRLSVIKRLEQARRACRMEKINEGVIAVPATQMLAAAAAG